MRQLLMALAITIPTCGSVWAWEAQTDWDDPMSPEVAAAVTMTNADGYTATVFRSEDRKMRLLLSLPASSFDRLPREGRIAMLRGDDHQARELNRRPGLGATSIQQAESDGRHVKNIIWHGGETSPAFGTFRDILDSEILFVRFFTDTGTSVDTTWPLEGFAEKAAAALQFTAEVDPEVAAWETLQMETLIEASNACGFDMQCNKRANEECFPLLVEEKDVDGYNRCWRQ